MKASFVCVAIIVGTVALMSGRAQADVIKHAVRLGAFGVVTTGSYVPLTTSGSTGVIFSGSGKFTIWYTAECAASSYVDVEILIDGIEVAPTGINYDDSFCDFETRGAMHTVTGRTGNLDAGTHTVSVFARKTDGVAYLSDSSMLIGK